jgi:hypothetical protein
VKSGYSDGDTKTVAAANGVQVPATGIDSTKLPDPACGGFDGATTGIGANKRLFRGKKTPARLSSFGPNTCASTTIH